MTDIDIVAEVLKGTRTPEDVRKVARSIVRKLKAAQKS